MRIAIVGYHGSGKTSVFRVLGGKPDEGSGRGGRVNLLNLKVPDVRLVRIAKEYGSKKITPAEITLVDVENISAGEKALSDEFLGHARACDALLLVLRAFYDEKVYNPRGHIDPAKDVVDLCEELILSDIEVVEGRMDKLEKEIQRGKKEGIAEFEVLKRIKERLDEGKSLRGVVFKPEEEKLLSAFAFMSHKPAMGIVNVNFRTQRDMVDAAIAECDMQRIPAIEVPAQLEVELLEIEDPCEKLAYLESYGYKEIAADSIIRKAYESLDAITFYVANESEARAIQLKRGCNAYEAAGKVHTDIQKGFVRAEVYSFDDLAECGCIAALRESGKCNLEKKECTVNDGDVIFFRFN